MNPLAAIPPLVRSVVYLIGLLAGVVVATLAAANVIDQTVANVALGGLTTVLGALAASNVTTRAGDPYAGRHSSE